MAAWTDFYDHYDTTPTAWVSTTSYTTGTSGTYHGWHCPCCPHSRIVGYARAEPILPAPEVVKARPPWFQPAYRQAPRMLASNARYRHAPKVHQCIGSSSKDQRRNKRKASWQRIRREAGL